MSLASGAAFVSIASSLYDRFDAVYLDAEPLAPRDEGSRYNIMSVYLTDGRVFHTAIVLSNDGAMFVMEAGHNEDAQSVDEVLSNLMYTIQNVRFEGPVVTEAVLGMGLVHCSRPAVQEGTAAVFKRRVRRLTV